MFIEIKNKEHNLESIVGGLFKVPLFMFKDPFYHKEDALYFKEPAGDALTLQ